MTTIAWDGRLLCADSQATCSYIHQYSVQKIFPRNSGRYAVVAICGNPAETKAICAWLFDDAKMPEFKSDCFALAITKEGEAHLYNHESAGYFLGGSPDALGSGQCEAIGAMMAGATAYRAVEIASRLDPHTGGAVQCYDFTMKMLTGPFGGKKVSQIDLEGRE